MAVHTRGWHRSMPALREALVVLTLFQLYRVSRLLTADAAQTAQANAADVLWLQTRLHLPDERAVQQWALAVDGLAQVANAYYLALHFPVVMGLLLWLFLRHRDDAYRWVRDLLVLTTFASLVIHLSFPLAPPRMLAGFVDTGVVHGMSAYAGMTANSANQIAAMPSLHVAWSAVVALAVMRVLRSRWRLLVWLHPVLTVLVVVVTANHYWLDAAVALLIVAGATAALAALPLLATRRPRPAAAPRPCTRAPTSAKLQRLAHEAPRLGASVCCPVAAADRLGRQGKAARREADEYVKWVRAGASSWRRLC